MTAIRYNPGGTQSWNIVGDKAFTPEQLANPAAPPKFDLNNPDFLRSLLDSSKFDYLKDFGKSNLPGQGYTFAGGYKPPTGTSENYFQDLMKNIGAPSSVDEVQSGVDSQMMNELLKGIDMDTKQAVGSRKMDFAEQGLLGPGHTSDIAENALAQIMGDSNRTKTGARLGFAGQELGRLKGREEAARGAYGTRYGVGAGADTQGRSIAAQGALSDAEMLNKLLTTQFGADVTGGSKFADIASGRDSQYFNNLLESLLKNKSIDSSDSQFFRGLENANSQGALGRDLDFMKAILGTRGPDNQGVMNSLKDGIGVTKGLQDIFGGIFGKSKLPAGEGGMEGGMFPI